MPSKSKAKKKYTTNAAAQARRNLNAPSQTESGYRPVSTTVRPRRNEPTPPPPSGGVPPIVLISAVAFVVIVVIALIVIAPWNNSNPATQGPTTALGEERFDNECKSNPCEHVATGTRVAYRLDPPLSGAHWDASQVVPWGFYDQPQQNERVVHNLEHGGIVIYYNCPNGCAKEIENLKVLANRYPPSTFTGILAAPRSSTPNNAKFVLTAWQTRLVLPEYDADKVQRFIEKYFAKGPEGGS